MLEDTQMAIGWAIPAPDGKHLAFWKAHGTFELVDAGKFLIRDGAVLTRQKQRKEVSLCDKPFNCRLFDHSGWRCQVPF